MLFVVGKNGLNTRKKARRVVTHTRKLFDEVVGHFYHNPAGDANFAAHVVASFVGMNNYLMQAAPCGSAKFNSRKMYKYYARTA